ncbi:hypothetical protein P9112_007890 [Eukaryota sp. TZLM1-RC]
MTSVVPTNPAADEARRLLKEQYQQRRSPQEKLASFRESRSRLQNQQSQPDLHPTTTTTDTSTPSSKSLLGSRGLKLLQKRKELLNNRKKNRIVVESKPTDSEDHVISSEPPTATTSHQLSSVFSPEQELPSQIEETPLEKIEKEEERETTSPVQVVCNCNHEVFEEKLSEFNKKLEDVFEEFRSSLNNVCVQQELIEGKNREFDLKISEIFDHISRFESEIQSITSSMTDNQSNLLSQLKNLEANHQMLESLWRSSTDSFKNRLAHLEDLVDKSHSKMFNNLFWLMVNYFISGLSTILVPVTSITYSALGVMNKTFSFLKRKKEE